MDRISDAELAIRVVDNGGFSAAAEASGLSQPAVSRRIRALEDRLGARLFERTTRRVRPTDAGLRYVARARQALHELSEAESEATQGAAAASGRVRVSAASAFARMRVVPRLAAFHEAHPGVQLELDLLDRYVDLVEEGYDVAIRVGAPRSTDLIARRLAAGRLRLCAAPAYLEGAPALRRPGDLHAHRVLVMNTYVPRVEWRFARRRRGADAPEITRVKLRPCAVYNDAQAIRSAVHAGCGVAVLPDYLVAEDLAEARLVALMPRYGLGGYTVHALFTARRHLRAPVRAFVSFLADALR